MPKPIAMTVEQLDEWKKTGRWPDEGGVSKQSEIIPNPIQHRFSGLERGAVRTRGRMNGTESKWAAELETQRLARVVFKWWFEPLRLRLTDAAPGQRAVYYTPDFLVQCTNGAVYVDDVKGGAVNDASIVRLKASASLFTLWTFRLVKRVKGGWEIKQL